MLTMLMMRAHRPSGRTWLLCRFRLHQLLRLVWGLHLVMLLLEAEVEVEVEVEAEAGAEVEVEVQDVFQL